MIGKYQMTAVGDEQPSLDGNRHRGLDCFGLFDERQRIQHHAAADHALHARLKDARWYEMKNMTAVAEADRVAGVMSALVARDAGILPRQDIDYFSLSFVAPLNANDCE